MAAAAALVSRTVVAGAADFTAGAWWSPDGLCVLTAGDDSVVRGYDLVVSGGAASPAFALGAALAASEPEHVRDCAWLPSRPAFACAALDQPVHLRDGFDGRRLASYAAADRGTGRPLSAVAVAFSPDGRRLLAGYRGGTRVFDVDRPGGESELRAGDGPREVVSALDACGSVYAEATYGGRVAVRAVSDGARVCELLGAPDRGVTQVLFAPDGVRLFAGGRRGADIVCWDVRHTRSELGRVTRACAGAQRLQFSLSPGDGRYLATGSDAGGAVVYDLLSPASPAARLAADAGCVVNAAAFCPAAAAGRSLVALATGARRRADDSERPQPGAPRPRLELWSFAHEGE